MVHLFPVVVVVLAVLSRVSSECMNEYTGREALHAGRLRVDRGTDRHPNGRQGGRPGRQQDSSRGGRTVLLTLQVHHSASR